MIRHIQLLKVSLMSASFVLLMKIIKGFRFYISNIQYKYNSTTIHKYRKEDSFFIIIESYIVSLLIQFTTIHSLCVGSFTTLPTNEYLAVLMWTFVTLPRTPQIGERVYIKGKSVFSITSSIRIQKMLIFEV